MKEVSPTTLNARSRSSTRSLPINFGFYYSPFHFHRAGDDPVVALRTLSERLVSVYFKLVVSIQGQGASRSGHRKWISPAICQEIDRVGYTEEIMLIYLGLKAETPQPIIEGGLQRACEVGNLLLIEDALLSHFTRYTKTTDKNGQMLGTLLFTLCVMYDHTCGFSKPNANVLFVFSKFL